MRPIRTDFPLHDQTISTPSIRPTSLPTNTSFAQLKSNDYGKTPHNSPQDGRPKPRKRPHSPVTSDPPSSNVVAGPSDDADLDRNPSIDDRDVQVQKRNRSAQWQSRESWDLEPDQPAGSPDKEGYHINQGRPSRFLEGSMNDRVSNTLPNLYIQGEHAMDQYHNGGTLNQTMRLTHHPNNSISHTSAGNESTKSLGFFRFGKAVASAFNPVHMWQGFNGRSRDKQESVVRPEVALLRERQIQADKAYAELKQSGFKGTNGASRAQHSSDLPTTKPKQDTEGPQAPLQLDSGIEVDTYRSSGELSGIGRASASNDYLLPPPPIPGFGRAASPITGPSSGKRPSQHLRSPSLQSLKKAMSQAHLPSVKRHSESLAPPLALAHNVSMQDVTDQRTLKSQPSRKELEKQEKLGKKVSLLEEKLNSARRELELAVGNDAPPGPSQYPTNASASGEVPFSSSERLSNCKTRVPQAEQHDLNKRQTEAAKDLDAALASSKARKQQHNLNPSKGTVEQKSTFAGRAAAKIEQHKKADSKKPVTNKRKSSGGAENDVRYKPDSDNDDDVEWEAAKTAPVRKPGRPRRLQKVEKDEVLVHDDRAMVEAAQPTSKPEKTSAAQTEPRHAIKTFEFEAVDKDKIMRMRLKSNRDAPFGQLSEDIVNLRKEYPSATDAEIVNYIASLLLEHDTAGKEETLNHMVNAPLDPLIEEKENPGMLDGKCEGRQFTSPRKLRKTYSEKTLTKHTSVAHPNEPAPTFLGRPRSASPLKKDDKQSPRLFSPPPSAGYSKPANLSATVMDAISASPAEDGSIPPMPKIPRELEAQVKPVRAAAVSGDALSKAEGEQYEWPEDVF